MDKQDREFMQALVMLSPLILVAAVVFMVSGLMAKAYLTGLLSTFLH